MRVRTNGRGRHGSSRRCLHDRAPASLSAAVPPRRPPGAARRRPAKVPLSTLAARSLRGRGVDDFDDRHAAVRVLSVHRVVLCQDRDSLFSSSRSTGCPSNFRRNRLRGGFSAPDCRSIASNEGRPSHGETVPLLATLRKSTSDIVAVRSANHKTRTTRPRSRPPWNAQFSEISCVASMCP